MTLIELMVVIVILVTLVAGVLPLVSPNNDGRKIGEASRALQTYFMQAQAEAARIGRPVGVGFRESPALNGVALEAFQMVVPPVYPGSSTLSRVGVTKPVSPTTYGVRTSSNQDGNQADEEDERFPSYRGATLYSVYTQLAVDVGGSRVDSLPPNMFKVGDIIEAEGNRFVIVDDPRNVELKKFPNGDRFLSPADNPTPDSLVCIRLEEVLQGHKVPPLAVPVNGYTYGVHRQPMGAERTNASPKERIITSGESPLQMPAGIAIDLMSSGFEANEMKTIFEEARPTYKDPNNSTNMLPLPYTVGILFSPNGGIDSVWVNSQRYTDASRVFFLVGRVENGNPPTELYTDWGRSGGGTTSNLSDEEFKDRQAKVNWLNLDSRWLMINGNDGRLTFNQNALVDPRIVDPDTLVDDEMRSSTPLEAREAQIEAAHGLAHGHNDGARQ